jgi:glycosyltransferase involved in cell wall biosynthesis
MGKARHVRVLALSRASPNRAILRIVSSVTRQLHQKAAAMTSNSLLPCIERRGPVAAVGDPRTSPAAPAVSVTMCTCNGAQFVQAQVQSILDQDLDDFELLVVDDASDDGTWDLLQSLALRDPRILLHRNSKRLGVNANFGRAFTLARGALIAPADQDDLWAPGKLSTLLQRLGDASAVYCDSELIDETGRSLGKKMSDLYRMYEGRDARVFTFLNCVSGHALLFRRELLGDVLPVARGRMYDQWVAIVATSRAGIRYVPEPLVRYRQHAAAVTDVLKARDGRINKKDLGKRLQRYVDDLWWLWHLTTLPGPHRWFFRRMYGEFCRRAIEKPSIVAVVLLLLYQRPVFFTSSMSIKARWKAIKRYRRTMKLDQLSALSAFPIKLDLPPLPTSHPEGAGRRRVT